MRETNDASQDWSAVAYAYQIGKYNVTAAQYCQFLNAVAETDPYRLYNVNMAEVGHGHFGCGITSERHDPAATGTWSSPAARTCPSITSAGPRPRGSATGSTTVSRPAASKTPARLSKGHTRSQARTEPTALQTRKRAAAAKYWIPTEHEWYKAAYYKGDGTNAGYWTFATRSNTKPSPVLSATGTNNANYQGADPARGLSPVGAWRPRPARMARSIRRATFGNGPTAGPGSTRRIERVRADRSTTTPTTWRPATASTTS